MEQCNERLTERKPTPAERLARDAGVPVRLAAKILELARLEERVTLDELLREGRY